MPLLIAEAANSGSAVPEHFLQYGLAQLLLSPPLLEEALRHGAAAAFADLPPETCKALDRALLTQGPRLSLVATMIDERVFAGVRALLPLTITHLGHATFIDQWDRFRRSNPRYHAETRLAWAVAFCGSMLEEPKASVMFKSATRDIVRYELTSVQVASRPRQVPTVPPGVSLMEPLYFSAVFHEIVRFRTPVSLYVKKLKASSLSSRRPKETSAATNNELDGATASGETLVFFRAWPSDQMRVVRLTRYALSLLTAWREEGSLPLRTSFRSTPSRPREEGGPDIILAELMQCGLLRPDACAARGEPANPRGDRM
jgi:hypothetical protein